MHVFLSFLWTDPLNKAPAHRDATFVYHTPDFSCFCKSWHAPFTVLSELFLLCVCFLLLNPEPDCRFSETQSWFLFFLIIILKDDTALECERAESLCHTRVQTVQSPEARHCDWVVTVPPSVCHRTTRCSLRCHCETRGSKGPTQLKQRFTVL